MSSPSAAWIDFARQTFKTYVNMRFNLSLLLARKDIFRERLKMFLKGSKIRRRDRIPEPRLGMAERFTLPRYKNAEQKFQHRANM